MKLVAGAKVGNAVTRAVQSDAEPTIPRFLYRYRAFRDEHDSLRKILQANLWYFGSRVNFDDQQDCIVSGIELNREFLEDLLPLRDGALSAGQVNQIEQFLSDPDAARRVAGEMQGYVDKVGILCLSELDDDSELWRIYADSGRGVCLQLDVTKLIESEPFLLRGPFEVMYRDGPKSFWNPMADEESRQAQTDDHLLRKGTKWAYQKEWRFIMHRGAEKTVGEYQMPVEALSAVILGRELTEDECTTVSDWLRTGPWGPMPCLYCRNPEQSRYWL